MNVRLQIKSSFLALVHYEDELFSNQYHVTMDLTTACEDSASQNIAMDRIMYLLQRSFTDSVMINAENRSQIRLYRAAGMRVTTLPQEPVDQIIGLMLYCKLNSVCEGRLVINSLALCSDHGNHVWYLHDESESVGPFGNPGWWHHATPLHWHTKDNSNTVVDLKTQAEWTRHELDWPSSTNTPSDGKVVFAKFDRDDKK